MRQSILVKYRPVLTNEKDEEIRAWVVTYGLLYTTLQKIEKTGSFGTKQECVDFIRNFTWVKDAQLDQDIDVKLLTKYVETMLEVMLTRLVIGANEKYIIIYKDASRIKQVTKFLHKLLTILNKIYNMEEDPRLIMKLIDSLKTYPFEF